MTEQQIEILKALHLLKEYCDKTICQQCMLATHDDEGNAECMFSGENITIPADWDNLKEVNKEEKVFTVFK